MILSFVSQKGGVGKSTLAYSVAWELQSRGRKVLMVDLDPQASLLAAHRQALAKALVPPDCIPLASSAILDVPTSYAHYDDIILDTPGRADDIQKAALMVSDVVLAPTYGSGFEVWASSETVALINRARSLRQEIADKGQGRPLAAALVVTRSKPNTSLNKSLQLMLSAAPIPVLRATTTHRVEWEEFAVSGRGVAQQFPKTKGADELRAITDEVLVLAGVPLTVVPRTAPPVKPSLPKLSKKQPYALKEPNHA